MCFRETKEKGSTSLQGHQLNSARCRKWHAITDSKRDAVEILIRVKNSQWPNFDEQLLGMVAIGSVDAASPHF